ncbi:MAG: DUF1501 domain-containing protein [Planctomycetaceae bacterium]
MLKIAGPKSRYCDGISRRSWMQIGSLGLGGMALPEILRAESQSAERAQAKSIIMVLLPGGPSHLDMYDLKPEAPTEIRGEFQPISTSVPGIDICELLPRLAANAEKFTFLRSLMGFKDDHNTHWCTTGWRSHPPMPSSPIEPGFPPGDWPSLGAVLSKQFGPKVNSVPACVDLAPVDPDSRFIMRTDPGQPGFLGAGHAGFKAQAVERGNLLLNGASLDRLANRRALLAGFDQVRRKIDRSEFSGGLDEFNKRAFEVLTTPRLAEALDLSREDAATRARYGLDRNYPGEREGRTHLDQFLLARRVIEAGARCVTLSFSRWPFGRMLRGDYNWDWHKDNFKEARGALPLFDLGLSALIEDLSERGLLEETAVVVWGEFGRTPKINANAGRDHWPKVGAGLLAGGGMKTGQVIGSTTRWGEEPLSRPVHFQEVFATLYRQLGIDTATTQLIDLAGRPQYLVDDHDPMPELIG